VVVGGGWGGFGAAYALLKAGVKVTILHASETPGGLSAGWRTPGGRSVEAGIKGYITTVPPPTASARSACTPRDGTPGIILCACCRFWYQYSNINALVGELGIDNPFTEWTRSSFWAPDGLQVMPYLFEHVALQLFALDASRSHVSVWYHLLYSNA